jgi:hypothetical protein
MIVAVGFVPVIGLGAAVLMESAVAVGTGKAIPEALVDAVVSAIPGGVLVKDAVLAAFEFGKAVLNGDAIEEAAIAAAREEARQLGGEAAAQGFDLIFAIARGEDLQEAGFAMLNHWFTGTEDLINKVGLFTSRMAEAATRGEPVEKVLLDEARSELASEAGAEANSPGREGLSHLVPIQEQVNRAIQILLAEPWRYFGSANAFAGELILPREVARAAFMSVEETPNGLRENAAFRSVFLDPNIALQGESQMAERTRKWVQRKIDKRNLVFREAERLTSFDQLHEHLQQRSVPTHPADTPLTPANDEGGNVRTPDLTPRGRNG